MNGTATEAPRAARRGRQPSRVHGVLPLDKPAGMTSFSAVREVRRLLGERRVGHAGTLDPTAVGLLPICVGQATRLVDYFHEQPKRYHCVVRLGERSDTLDTEGTVTPGGDASELTDEAVREGLRAFVGDIMQLPPMHSAVRHDGRHLYELARAGTEVERTARAAHVYAAEVVAFRPGRVAEAEIDVRCGKGTYMRVLAADLGDALGCGGLLGWLARTEYGSLTREHAVTLEALAAMADPSEALLPPAVAVDHLPRIDLIPALAQQVRRGQSVWVPRVPEPRPAGMVRVHDAAGTLLALGELQSNLFRPEKVIAAS